MLQNYDRFCTRNTIQNGPKIIIKFKSFKDPKFPDKKTDLHDALIE